MLALGEEVLHRRELVGLHADQEAVRRVGRRAAPPGVDQVVAREGEQQHRGQAEREARHLHRVAARVAPQVGEAVAHACACRTARDRACAREQLAARPRRRRRTPATATAKPPTTVTPSLQVARLPDEQRGERDEAGRVGRERAAAAARRTRAGSRAPPARSSAASAAAARSRAAAPGRRGSPAPPAAAPAPAGRRADAAERRRRSLPAPRSPASSRAAQAPSAEHQRTPCRRARAACACVAPRQRITAQPSRWRSTKRRVPSAIATPARTAASSAVRPRKRCARSIDGAHLGPAGLQVVDALAALQPRASAQPSKRATCPAAPAAYR